ncbi:MAG: glycerate kinase [Deltaproteobacteria bacterium]|nr:glycerate kinase [Deltaproteobacteria bacterium]
MRRKELYSIFYAGVEAVDPYRLVLQAVRLDERNLKIGDMSYDLNHFKNIIVIGAGKAAAPMAQAIESVLGRFIADGRIIVKYGHAAILKRIKVMEASHPVPDEAGVKETENIIKMLQRADEQTLVICLISGGASALLVSPADSITLEDKKIVTELLLKAGATIDELNTVRKHLSKVKGGRLIQIASPVAVVTLILSDVIGDRLDVIASGPTTPDPTTFKDAMAVIKKYRIEKRLPSKVLKLLRQGINGMIKDTPKGDESFFRKTKAVVIGSLKNAIASARGKAISLGFNTDIITYELQGEARDAARYLSARAIEVRNSTKKRGNPRCLISGGETTVTVKGKGVGGRNQELALSFAMEIEGMKGIIMLSAGTDGTDGPTDAAGAIVNGNTAILARELGIIPEIYLENNNSYNFFKRLDFLSKRRYHFLTGPTGTNVMDIQIILVER